MMAGRTRRVRILVLVVFGAIAFFLYNRNATPVNDYREYYANKPVGGGAALRPQPEEAQPPASGPDLEPSLPIRPKPPAPAPARTSKHHTSTTTSAKSPSSVLPQADPTPELPLVRPIDHDLPYQVGEGRVEVDVPPSPSTIIPHWSKMPEHFPISSTIQLPSGTSKPMPRIQRAVDKLSKNGADQERLAIIKAATEHSWRGYKEFAWASDEVRPISGKKNNPFNAWGATLVDSLDTLWVTGMKTEFEEAVEAVNNIDFTTSPRSDIPVFETTIRYLGGLIAAYDVSGKKYHPLLHKAVELADVLYSIFDTPNRMPQTFFRWKPQFSAAPRRAGTRVVLAEIGTLSLEFTRLAQFTGEPKYYDAIARITDAFEEWQNSTRLPGMWPTQLDASGCGKPLQAPVTHTEPIDFNHDMVTGDPVKVDDETHFSQKSTSNEATLPNDPTLSNKKRQLDSELIAPSTNEQNDNSTAHHVEIRQPPSLPTTDSQSCLPQGLASSSPNGGETYTLSGASDSMYEYLPKEYILLGGQEEKYRTMYLDSAAVFIEKLLYKPMTKDERNVLLTGELRISPNYTQEPPDRNYIETFKPELAHLACFAGGMFAMGGVLFNKPEHVEIGSKLTDGCVWAYNVTATGIMPEGAELVKCEDTWGDCPWNETVWWKALDPYVEERTKLPDPVPMPTSSSPVLAQSAPAGSVAKATQPAAADIGPPPKIDLNKKDEEFAASVAKRQLREAPVDGIASPPRPAPADGPASPLRPASVDELVAPPRPPLPDLGQGVAPDLPPTSSIYQPEQPLSHEEFVQRKIEEERLPPGYTHITFRKYILRPEAIESVFYMYRITGNQYWRDVGWNMFTSIDSHTRAPHGNSAIDDVTKSAPEPKDEMESFWLAETLKYFYLLYDDPDKWSLNDWVLNTEAHLFRRPEYEFAKV